MSFHKECQVPGCFSTADKGYIMFFFPDKRIFKVMWAKICGVPIDECNEAVVCNKHFAFDDYKDWRKGADVELKEEALPTLYLKNDSKNVKSSKPKPVQDTRNTPLVNNTAVRGTANPIIHTWHKIAPKLPAPPPLQKMVLTPQSNASNILSQPPIKPGQMQNVKVIRDANTLNYPNIPKGAVPIYVMKRENSSETNSNDVDDALKRIVSTILPASEKAKLLAAGKPTDISSDGVSSSTMIFCSSDDATAQNAALSKIVFNKFLKKMNVVKKSKNLKKKMVPVVFWRGELDRSTVSTVIKGGKASSGFRLQLIHPAKAPKGAKNTPRSRPEHVSADADDFQDNDTFPENDDASDDPVPATPQFLTLPSNSQNQSIGSNNNSLLNQSTFAPASKDNFASANNTRSNNFSRMKPSDHPIQSIFRIMKRDAFTQTYGNFDKYGKLIQEEKPPKITVDPQLHTKMEDLDFSNLKLGITGKRDPVTSNLISIGRRLKRAYCKKSAEWAALKKRCKELEKTSFKHILETHQVSPLLKQFIQSELDNLGKKEHGNRWTEIDKSIAAAIYKQSPLLYKTFRNMGCMPPQSTVQRYLRDTGESNLTDFNLVTPEVVNSYMETINEVADENYTPIEAVHVPDYSDNQYVSYHEEIAKPDLDYFGDQFSLQNSHSQSVRTDISYLNTPHMSPEKKPQPRREIQPSYRSTPYSQVFSTKFKIERGSQPRRIQIQRKVDERIDLDREFIPYRIEKVEPNSHGGGQMLTLSMPFLQ